MKITQPSERKLVCRKDSKMREISMGIAGTTAFWIVIGILYAILTPSKPSYNPSLGIITYAIFCFGAIAFTYDQTATFDLDAHSLQIESYFPLFKKRVLKEYNLAIIRRIVVEKQRDSCNYIIVIKQHRGDNLYLPSPHYCCDILMVDAEAQKIRDFLSLDVRI
jgi:hypothetical protein